MNIYLASSWRNPHHAGVLALLRADGHDVYDFKHPTHRPFKACGACWHHGACTCPGRLFEKTTENA